MTPKRPQIHGWNQYLTWIAVACQALCTVYLAVEIPETGGEDVFHIRIFFYSIGFLVASTVGCIVAALGLVRRERWASVGLIANVLWPFLYGLTNFWVPKEVGQWAEQRQRLALTRSSTWGGAGGIRDFIVQHDGKILIAGNGLARLQPNGAFDPTFWHPNAPTESLPSPHFNPRLLWASEIPIRMGMFPNGDLLVTSDGWLSGGQFERISSTGQSIPSFPDLGLDPSTGEPKIWRAGCNALWIAADGSALLDANGWGSNDGEFVRLLPDGKEDVAFNERAISGPIGLVRSLIPLPTGKILAAGKLLVPATQEHARLLRMNADGSLDPAFHVSPVSESDLAQEEPSIAALLADQSILLAHSVRLQSGYSYSPGAEQDRSTVQQLTGDGILMNSSTLASHIQGRAILSLVTALNGSVLIGGWTGIARFFPNGEADRSFHSPPYRPGRELLINVSKIQTLDNKILVLYGWGRLSRKLLRLNWDGSVDSGFRVPDLRLDDSKPATE